MVSVINIHSSFFLSNQVRSYSRGTHERSAEHNNKNAQSGPAPYWASKISPPLLITAGTVARNYISPLAPGACTCKDIASPAIGPPNIASDTKDKKLAVKMRANCCEASEPDATLQAYDGCQLVYYCSRPCQMQH